MLIPMAWSSYDRSFNKEYQMHHFLEIHSFIFLTCRAYFCLNAFLLFSNIMEMTVLDWLYSIMLHVSRTQPTFLRHTWYVMNFFGLTNAPND